jgi:hypothetical protein
MRHIHKNYISAGLFNSETPRNNLKGFFFLKNFMAKKIQKHNRASTFEAFIQVTPSNVSLAKASHMNKPNS